MSQSEWVCLQMAVGRTKFGNLQNAAKFKGKFSLFTSDGTNFNYDPSGLLFNKIFKTHNKFFVG